MKKIGITGGIGSGKSTVCKLFALFGIPVYNADDEAKNILEEKKEVKDKIVALFGNNVLTSEGKVDRVELAKRVFNHKENLEKLNTIVHPAVALHFDAWLKKQQGCPYILKEAAILFESGAYQQTDAVITVTAPLELKMKRVMERSAITRDEVMQRMNNQWNDEEKLKRSAYEIQNDEAQLIIPQILKIHAALTAEK